MNHCCGADVAIDRVNNSVEVLVDVDDVAAVAAYDEARYALVLRRFSLKCTYTSTVQYRTAAPARRIDEDTTTHS